MTRLDYMMRPHTGKPMQDAPPPTASPSHVFPGYRVCTESEQSARLVICAMCAYLLGGNCRICQTCGGRSVVSKVRLNVESCPLNKWMRIPS